MLYVLLPNETLRKQRDVSLADILSGKADPSSIREKRIRHKHSAKCVASKNYKFFQLPGALSAWREPKKLKMQRFLNLLVHMNDIATSVEYETYHIPKHSGGFRTISEPNEKLKHVQKTINRALNRECTTTHHSAAFAYCKKRSAKDSIVRHQKAGSRWFLKLDLKNFFDNCSPDLFFEQTGKILNWSRLMYRDEVMDRIQNTFKRLCFLNDSLPQGAPTSPTLSNMLMIPFDYELSRKLRAKGFVYTRYADDMLISHKERFNKEDIVKLVSDTLRENGYPFEINTSKIRFGSISGRNWNLGLMLNKDNDITVGWRNKKLLKAMLTDFATDQDNKRRESKRARLQGIVSYHRMIDSEYTDHLIQKYSNKYNIDIEEQLKA